MPRKKKSVELDEDEPSSEPIEEYAHGSLANGDVPPPHIAKAIENQLRDNPYANVSTDELKALALELYRTTRQLSLVESVLQARNSAW